MHIYWKKVLSFKTRKHVSANDCNAFINNIYFFKDTKFKQWDR